jgi:hypothetical protein
MMRENKQIKKILCSPDFFDGWEGLICFTAKFAVKCGAGLCIYHQKSPLWWKSEHSDKSNDGKLNKQIQRADEAFFIKKVDYEFLVFGVFG